MRARRRDFVDLTGQRFGKWTVLAYHATRRYENGNAQAQWRCRCDCGTVSLVWGHAMRRGGSTRCMECQKAAMTERGKKMSVRLPDGRTIAQIAAASGLLLDTVYHRHIRGWPAWRLAEMPQKRSA
jgi:hypothetical protein